MHKWLSIPEYTKETGLSRESIKTLIAAGELISTTTDGGGKTLIKVDYQDEELKASIFTLVEMIDGLARHLGVGYEESLKKNVKDVLQKGGAR